MRGSRVNNTGRSTGRLRQNRREKIKGQFVAMTDELLASPALGALNLSERRLLDRLLIEHMAHAGTENGNLICTYDNFVEFGIRRSSIASGLRVLEKLGLIEIVERGRPSYAEYHHPSRYRLTFVMGNITPTNEWSRFKDRKLADEITKAARGAPKKNPRPKIDTSPSPDNGSPCS